MGLAIFPEQREFYFESADGLTCSMNSPGELQGKCFLKTLAMGISANATAAIAMICVREEGNPVQHDLVGQCCFKLPKFDPEQFIFDKLKHSTTLENFHIA